MDIESVKTITNGVVEVAKFWGPSIITAILGYTLGKLQFKERIRELEKKNAYSASERLFEYYQNREKELDESYKSINEDMGFLLGMDMGIDMALDSAEDKDSLNKTIKIYEVYEKMLPYQIKLTMRDLEKYSLQETEEFIKLKSFLDQNVLHDQKNNLSDKIAFLLEVYFYLQICNKMILEELSTNYMKVFVK
jgi:hypothetical protein